ncbi:MAG: hypothetical protein GMKNLPBB_02269 [Myxococcota bacterium]|nr:hypothetical protein [Myxococcota bacterium]
MLKLPGGAERGVEVTTQGIAIGRDPVCQLQLPVDDYLASRNHARAFSDRFSTIIEDVGSRNGTFVNGLRTGRAVLREGDVITIGKQTLLFRNSAMVFANSGETPAPPESILSRHVDAYVASQASEAQPEPAPPGLFRHEPKGSLLQRKLELITKLSGKLNTAVETRQVIEPAVKNIAEFMHADRAYLLNVDEKTGTVLSPAVVVLNPFEPGVVSMSSTIASRCINERSAILVRDLRFDPSMQDAQSVISQGINTAMCVPLLARGGVRGILYVDRRAGKANFDEDDMDLLIAVSHQLAMALERDRLVEEIRNQEALRAHLGKFLDRKVIEFIESVPPGERQKLLAPKETMATVMFSDIVGFTTISQGKTPVEVAHFINEYFSVMTDIIFRHNGTLDKYIGDAIMAVFGAPIPGEQDHANAVRAALEMIDARNNLMSQHTMHLQLNHRIGINTGPLVAGQIGSPHRMEYGVLGDTVNIASRIEGKAEPNSVFITEATYKLVKGQFECEDRGLLQVKGRDPVHAYKVLRAL